MDLNRVVVCDIECYQNYFLIMFKRVSDGKVLSYEKFNDSQLNRLGILRILENYTVVTFNGIGYDTIVLDAAMTGFNNKKIHELSTKIITSGQSHWMVRRNADLNEVAYDHIDLMQVAPLKASLKIYGGRLGCPTMQDLPIEPDAIIQDSDRAPMKQYCENDLDVTHLLLNQLLPEIELREDITKEYGDDVRSKSDAQIAEAIIKSEIKKSTGDVPQRMVVKEGTEYRYKCPDNIKFSTAELQAIHALMITETFTVGKSGHVGLPKSLHNKKLQIGDTKYKIGIGGLHSCEKSIRHTNDSAILRDYDVASYYPRIILNNKLYPENIGPVFLDIYNSIVERRLKAKKEGNQPVNESLKITINGSFGKFGSKWSCMYSPRLVMQVTLTGQLSLLMLIETLEEAGIPVVSANTDGIVVKCPPALEPTAERITKEWQEATEYELESTDYVSLNSRDVNNYIAVKDGSCKGKGAFVDQNDRFSKLRSNPNNGICTEAVKNYLLYQTPVQETILACQDVTKFLTVKTVNGGALKRGEYLGKAVRWYYGAYEMEAIHYKTNGNKVARSDDSVPLMTLPDNVPDDMDYDWYISEAKGILVKIGIPAEEVESML